MRQITEFVNPTDAGIGAGFNNLGATAGAFDEQPEVAGTACVQGRVRER
jgi:hypothetical protein